MPSRRRSAPIEPELPLDTAAQPPAVVPLIPIELRPIGGAEAPSVSARDLHRKLEVGRDFSNWIKARIRELGLAEGIQYVRVVDGSPIQRAKPGRGGNRRPVYEYILTVPTARDVALAERNAAGRMLRQFLELQIGDVTVYQQPAAALPPEIDLDGAVVGPILGGIKRNMPAWLEPFREKISKAQRDRDAALFGRLAGLERAVGGFISAIAAGSVESRDLAVARAAFADLTDVYRLAGTPDKIPRRAMLSSAVKRSLDGFCRRLHFVMDQVELGGRAVDLWHRDGVTAWLTHSGRAMIREHIERYGQAEQA